MAAKQLTTSEVFRDLGGLLVTASKPHHPPNASHTRLAGVRDCAQGGRDLLTRCQLSAVPLAMASFKPPVG